MTIKDEVLKKIVAIRRKEFSSWSKKDTEIFLNCCVNQWQEIELTIDKILKLLDGRMKTIEKNRLGWKKYSPQWTWNTKVLIEFRTLKKQIEGDK